MRLFRNQPGTLPVHPGRGAWVALATTPSVILSFEKKKKMQNFKREEQNFVVMNEINNMSFLTADSKSKMSKVSPRRVPRWAEPLAPPPHCILGIVIDDV